MGDKEGGKEGGEMILSQCAGSSVTLSSASCTSQDVEGV